MNFMEASLVATPVLGAIGGVVNVSAPCMTARIIGAISGIVIGVAIYFTTAALSSLLMKWAKIFESNNLKFFQELALRFAIGLLLLTPIIAFLLSYLFVGCIAHFE
jgi:hypothetical protein